MEWGGEKICKRNEGLVNLHVVIGEVLATEN